MNFLKNVYESEKNETPIPRGYPPFAGKIAWARHIYRFGNYLMQNKKLFQFSIILCLHKTPSR